MTVSPMARWGAPRGAVPGGGHRAIWGSSLRLVSRGLQLPIHMDNPYCSCKLTCVRRCHMVEIGQEEPEGGPTLIQVSCSLRVCCTPLATLAAAPAGKERECQHIDGTAHKSRR